MNIPCHALFMNSCKVGNAHPVSRFVHEQLTEDVIRNKYEAGQLETLEYLDLGRGKWRSVEVRGQGTKSYHLLMDTSLLGSFAAR